MATGGGGSGGQDFDAGADGFAAEASDVGDAAGVSDASDGNAIIDAPPLRPTGVTLGALITATQYEIPSNGGNPFNDTCPPNQVLIGFNGTVASIDGGQSPIATVQGVCGTLSVTSTEPYQVKVATANTLPMRWVTAAVPVSAMCPADQIVVGFGGRYGQFVDGLDFRCAPLVIAGTSPALTLSVGATTTTSTIGSATGATPFTPIFCPNNQVAVSQLPHAGALIDAFALACATPSLLLQ
jgi:hypothetical protein